MEFVPIAVFDNYIDAHIALGQLEESGIRCWLKDENTLATNPLWNQALGGIKLMVAEEDLEDAKQLVVQYKEARQKLICPACGSTNVELVSTPRKATNWLFALLGSVGAEKVYHCFDCGHETGKLVEDPQ